MEHLTDKLQVKFFDTDQNSLMTAFSFFNYMQDVAWRNASATGIGYEKLSKQNMFWVLSRMKLTIEKTPTWADQISLTTRPRGAEGAFALRDFVFQDNDGKQFAYASSYWLILKADTLRPQRISEALSDVYEMDTNGDFEQLGKIVVSGEKLKSKEFTPNYSDIDMNMHVNNAVYAKWTTDLFDYYFLQSHTLAEIQINYTTAAKFGDKLVLSLYQDGDYFFAECTEQTKGSKIFQAKTKWKQIK